MAEGFDSQSSVMARLTISALEKAVLDSSSWKNPVVHKALLVSGLSVLLSATQLLQSDLERNQ